MGKKAEPYGRLAVDPRLFIIDAAAVLSLHRKHLPYKVAGMFSLLVGAGTGRSDGTILRCKHLTY